MKFDAEWASKRNSLTSPSVIAIMATIVRNEGGWSDRAADRCGPKNYGITIGTARKYGTAFDYDNDGVVSLSDLRKITPIIAMAFYSMEYFYQPNISLLPSALWPCVTDTCVTSGAGNAVMILQRTLKSLGKNIAVDKSIGPMTIAAASSLCASLGSANVVNHFVAQRNVFFRNIVANDPNQAENLNGWLNRSNRFKVAQ